MDLRQLDPAIGRWLVQDPVVHHDYSPYSAFDNNPVYWSDPSGANSVRYNWGSGDYDVLDKDGKWVGSFGPGMLGDYQNNPEEFLQSFFSLEAPTDDIGGGSDGGGSGSFSAEPQNPLPQLFRALFRILTKAPKGKLAKEAVKTSSKFSKITPKIAKQMERRGWTKESIHETVNNAYTTRGATNRATGNRATAYFRKDGSYIVRDNVTNEVIQVSNRLDPKWIPDATITNPYIPK
ncbi:RHS repeat-associated core domain-containing protein [Paenimyroides ummariense]|uniref:RHS repeat-associated core domain-containing protein n=2 Tax=Paenimyroides ummariense TaxID=913024 RepID=A0A1I5GT14_9FLAO|nr:RHS repeat-associated core domain-containing protein [Paenimyroides ummariense]